MANHKKPGPAFGPRDLTRPDILPIAETIEFPAAMDIRSLGFYTPPPAPTVPVPIPVTVRRDQSYVPSRRR
ncbi:MAG: hypothetical protein ACRDNS_24330, partial [Trebonia sp.]